MSEPAAPVPLRRPGRFASLLLVDLLLEALRHLVRHPLRTALTAVTSAVAVAVTVNVISLSYGLDDDITRDVVRFGLNTVDVGRMPILAPGARRAPLGPPEAERVRALLADLPAEIVLRRQAGATLTLPPGEGPVDAAGLRVQALAASPGYLRTLQVGLAAGRWLSAEDRGRPVCALDRALAERLWPGRAPADALGRALDARLPEGSLRLTVVGVLDDPLTHRALFDAFDEGQGARTLTSSLLSFRNLYLPDGALGGGDLSGLSVVLEREQDVDEAARRLGTLWPRLSMDPKAFGFSPVGVFVRRDWMTEMRASTAQGALLGNVVWLLIVLVAAVMLSTLHLITVRERYDELAIRRCEGARRGDVAWQVTFEGVATSLAGGLLGLPLGYAAAAVLRRLVDFPFRFEARYAVAATGVAVLLGLLASVVPARRAAGLDPARILTRRLT